MKKFIAAALSVAMVATLVVGCSSGSSSSSTSTTAAAAAEASDDGADEVVEVEEVVVEDLMDDWSDMTSDELYELALEEGGTITVYSTSSKMLKAEDGFEEMYPGLDVDIMDLDNDEVLQKARLEVQAGNVYGDVLQAKDANGEVYYEYVEDEIIENFYPTDICAKIDPGQLEFGFPLYTGVSTWYYNTEAYPDGQPVNSWWEIIENDENGNQKYRIFTKEIGSETTYLALLASFIANSDEMEQAYKDTYGEDLEYTYDTSAFDFDCPTDNAGIEFLWRLSQCKMTFIGDGDELVEAVHNSTADDPALALASAGKITNRDDSGFNIAWLTNLTPYTSTFNNENLYVVSGCPHPAGARLFIRYICGGENGDDGGFDVFAKEGTWPVRDDIEDTWNPVTIEDIGGVPSEMDEIYDWYYYAQNMWTYWLDKSPYTN